MCTSNPGWLAIARAFTEPELMELQSVKDDSLAMSKTLIMVPWFSPLIKRPVSGCLMIPPPPCFQIKPAWTPWCVLQSVNVSQDFVRQDGGTTSGYIERLAAQLVLSSNRACKSCCQIAICGGP